MRRSLVERRFQTERLSWWFGTQKKLRRALQGLSNGIHVDEICIIIVRDIELIAERPYLRLINNSTIRFKLVDNDKMLLFFWTSKITSLSRWTIHSRLLALVGGTREVRRVVGFSLCRAKGKSNCSPHSRHFPSKWILLSKKKRKYKKKPTTTTTEPIGNYRPPFHCTCFTDVFCVTGNSILGLYTFI